MYKRAFKTHFFKFVFVCLFSIFPGCASPSRNSFLGTSKPPEFSHPLKKPRMKKWASFYAHLNSFKVTEGQWIQKGDQLGSMGKTGRATGIHLHFEVRYNKRPIDPNVVLNKVKVSTQL